MHAAMPTHIYKALFADDVAMFLPCIEISTGLSVLQDCLDTLANWALENGFTFSPTKSYCIHFCRLYSCNHHIALSLGGVTIPTSTSTIYLGMTLDYKLQWREPINKLKHSCTQKLNIIRKLANTSYGADTTSLVNIYKAIIQSKLDYEVVAYSSASSSLLR